MAGYHRAFRGATGAIAVGGSANGVEVSDLPARSGSGVGLAEIFAYADLLADLRAVEEVLLSRMISRSALIAEAGAYTIRAGGKRLRAALVLLAARLGTYELSRVIHAAAAVELIQAASLVHDDLVDQASRRRGHLTVHARWDNDVALMVGDFFFALAAAEMAISPDPRIITYYAQAVQTIVEGELSPVLVAEPLDEALAQYYYKTGAKTAALFEAACKAGMASGGGSEVQIDALGRYGFDFGMAFQIVDDVLDFVGDEQILGKPAGNDLRQGTITLPLIYALARSNSPSLRAIVNRSNRTEQDVRAAVNEVIATGGVAAALDEAHHWVERAISHLAAFPPSAARRALVDLAHFVINRNA